MWYNKKKVLIKSEAKADAKPYKKNYTKTIVAPGADFKNIISNSNASFEINKDMIADQTKFHKKFLGLVARYYPAASSSVWTWKNLCATTQSIQFIGGTEGQRDKAKTLTDELDERISPLKFVKGGGMDFVVSMFFKYLFTYGRFSGHLIIDENLGSVKGFKIIDPFTVKFVKLNDEIKPYIKEKDGFYHEGNPNTFFYYALNMDLENPYGSAMIEAAWSMMEMSQEMLEDMKLSSANAGIPRLHISIAQPEQIDGETSEDYVDRISTYFDSYVEQLSDIAPDDNFYSWDDVDIKLVGGSSGGGGFVWRTNRQVFDEEILSAYHLFPWIVGKSTQTTKNWVGSQFDLLFSVVESLHSKASNFVKWVRTVDLNLHGIVDVKIVHTFDRLRDPAAKDFALADRFKIANVKSKILGGFITSDDGARELGYNKCADKDLIFKIGDSEDARFSEDTDLETNASYESLNTRLDLMEYQIDTIVADQENEILKDTK